MTAIEFENVGKQPGPSKLPVGIQDFESLIEDGYVYVDKTRRMYEMVTSGRHYFLSRPRRFGKSLLVSTLKAFFEGKRDLFKGMEVFSLEKKWDRHPIFHIDLSPENYRRTEDLISRLNLCLTEWESIYGKKEAEVSLAARFEGVLKRAVNMVGTKAVILVDEYDKPLLSTISNEPLQEELRFILKSFYSVLKTQDGNICFSLLTGVTKFSKVSIFSDLNNLNDISRDRKYADICGITQTELETTLGSHIDSFAAEYGMETSQLLVKFKKMYDGYRFTSSPVCVYNPFSIIMALQKREFGNYWFETGTPSYIVDLLKKGSIHLEDLTRYPVFIEELDSADGKALPVLYQSGYLTITGHNPDSGQFTLDYPNDEVREGFFKYLFPHYAPTGGGTFEISKFLSDLQAGDAENFMKRLQSFFADFDYSAQESPEAHYRNVLFILCKLLGLQTDAEYRTSDGRIDLLIRTSGYVYIMEFKLGASAEEALAQIRRKEYSLPWTCEGRSLVNIGVNFSPITRKLDGWLIEQENRQ